MLRATEKLPVRARSRIALLWLVIALSTLVGVLRRDSARHTDRRESKRIETPQLLLTASPPPASQIIAVLPEQRQENQSPNPASPEAVLEQFNRWAEAFQSANAIERAALAGEGEELARRREAALASLIEADPELALANSVPVRLRQNLPDAIVQHLEERVASRGDLAVIAALPDGDAAAPVAPIERFVTVADRTYRAFVYGRRLGQSTSENIPLHGIAVGDALALHESPLRALEPGETPDPTLPVHNPDERCPISRQASARAAAAQVGNEIVYLCSPGHAASLGEELAEQENSAIKPMASPWSQGTKTVLFMRAVFTDDTAESISESGARTLMTNVSNWFAECSYSTTEMIATITPPLTMPKTKQWYKTNNNYNALLTDARAVAKANGYDTADYKLDCVHLKSTFGGWTGRGYVGAKGAWLQSGNSLGVPCHEFGHNYGLWHANFWNATGDTIIGPGANSEYGNIFDTMGSASAGDKQFNAYEKNKLAWLPSANVLTIATSGVYRVYAFDVPALNSEFKYALKIRKDTRDYWVELRRKFAGNKWVQNGVLLTWSPWTSSASGSQLLDTTPGSPAANVSRDDAALVVGRTFTDPFAGVHITPVRKNAAPPESMEVVVNLGWFPENQRPTVTIAPPAKAAIGTPVSFSAIALDPDDDTLAYYWDFGDQNFGTNGPTATKSWSSAGDYVVRCTVTDMKGGTASDAVLVRVGTPATLRIAGRVTLDGEPLDGVRVYASSNSVTYTDADGYYTLTGLSSGSNTVNAVKAGYVIARENFSNPVMLGASMNNMNFTATPALFSVAGRVTDNNGGVAGVMVGVGESRAVTRGSGAYSLTNVPAGRHTLSASKSGYEFRPSNGWTNPMTVEWSNLTNRNFERPLFTISGTISGISAGATVSIGETNHQTVSTSNRGTGTYSLSVPRGQWNLVARLNGFTIRPANFANPVSVSASAGAYNFSATPGSTFSISGNISEGDEPLPGVLVTAGPEKAHTDSAGNYEIVGLANGTYELVPSRNRFTFSPPTLAVTIDNGAVANQDFIAIPGAQDLALSDPVGSAPGFGFKISGALNTAVRVEISNDLVSWETLTTITNATGDTQFFDRERAAGTRFYRAIQLP